MNLKTSDPWHSTLPLSSSIHWFLHVHQLIQAFFEFKILKTFGYFYFYCCEILIVLKLHLSFLMQARALPPTPTTARQRTTDQAPVGPCSNIQNSHKKSRFKVIRDLINRFRWKWESGVRTTKLLDWGHAFRFLTPVSHTPVSFSSHLSIYRYIYI